jgi:protein-disulfide isomerase
MNHPSHATLVSPIGALDHVLGANRAPVVVVEYGDFEYPNCKQAAEAAECAGAQGKFWEMHELLYANQTHLDTEHLLSYAEQLGLDLARFTAELDGQVYIQRIREHMAGGKSSGVRGTPGFFVNGRIQDVSFGLYALFDATDVVLSSLRKGKAPGF